MAIFDYGEDEETKQKLFVIRSMKKENNDRMIVS